MNILYSCGDTFTIIFHDLHPVLKVSNFLGVQIKVYNKLTTFYKSKEEGEESDDEIIDLAKDEESDYINEANNSDDDY